MTLVLVTREGSVLGALPPFRVGTPFWPDVAPVIEQAQAAHQADVTVLRLLEATPDPADRYGMGGRVTYLAECGRDVPASLVPWDGHVGDHRLRACWARPGGPAEDMAWADQVLGGLGRPRTGPAQQVKTWNLSSLWRLPTSGGDTWLKAVPPFFSHEGRLMAALAGPGLPEVLSIAEGRCLMDDVPGEDQYGAARPVLARMVDLLVTLQTKWVRRVSELLALGLPDYRWPSLGPALADLVERHGHLIDRPVRKALDRLIAELEARFTALDACGLSDTLVHGDFHPGNFRAGPDSLVLLDWGDSGVGCPLLDMPAFLDATPEGDRETVRELWRSRWIMAIPGSDPVRAEELIGPIAELRQALIYQRFLDGIEPSEHVYHQADVPEWLRKAAASATQRAS